MKLARIEVVRDIGPKQIFRLVFDNDGKEYTKLREGVMADKWTGYGMLRSCKEAERDAAYDMFGDSWQEYVGRMKDVDSYTEACAKKIHEFLYG